MEFGDGSDDVGRDEKLQAKQYRSADTPPIAAEALIPIGPGSRDKRRRQYDAADDDTDADCVDHLRDKLHRLFEVHPGQLVRKPSVTSPLCAANAARTSPFSRSGTSKTSSVRPSSAATSSNSAGEI